MNEKIDFELWERELSPSLGQEVWQATKTVGRYLLISAEAAGTVWYAPTRLRESVGDDEHHAH